MKKRFLIILSALAMLLSGCAQPQSDKKLQVVAAIFPEYDWVRQIVGDDDSVELTLLVDDGVDPHSFQPAVSDMVTAANCDLLIYGGGESDQWLTKLESTNPNRETLVLLPLLGAQAHQEEVVEGMEAHEEDEPENDAEMDEHVWLSLRNASFFCQAITDALCDLNPGKADTYRANLAAYQQQLNALDVQYQQAVSAASQHTIVVCDRFPFRYLVEDYNLNYYAAFAGCSAESEASFETVSFLAKKVDELALPCVLTIEGKEHKIAQTIVQNTKQKDQKVMTMDSMQATTSDDVKNGVTYLSVMENDLAVLKQALN